MFLPTCKICSSSQMTCSFHIKAVKNHPSASWGGSFWTHLNHTELGHWNWTTEWHYLTLLSLWVCKSTYTCARTGLFTNAAMRKTHTMPSSWFRLSSVNPWTIFWQLPAFTVLFSFKPWELETKAGTEMNKTIGYDSAWDPWCSLCKDVCKDPGVKIQRKMA